MESPQTYIGKPNPQVKTKKGSAPSLRHQVQKS